MFSEDDQKTLELLARKLDLGQLVLFAGAGLSRQAKRIDGTTGRLPLWDELANAVGDACGEKLSEYNQDPTALFDAIVASQTRDALEEAVRQFLDQDAYSPSEVHKIIGRLPWRMIYTTNYDDLLDRAVGERNPIDGELGYERLQSKISRPKIIHLHGTIDSLSTLTGKDYALWEDTHPRSIQYLRQFALENTILFAGYSFSDPHLKNGLLPWLQKILGGADHVRHYALMWRIKLGNKRVLEDRFRITATSVDDDAGWLSWLAELERLHSSAGSSPPRKRKPRVEPPIAEQAVINGYKMFYFRHKQKITLPQLKKATGIDIRRLRKYEQVSKREDHNEKCFKKCSISELIQIETQLGVTGGLRFGAGDDFMAAYILYYNVHKSQLGKRNYQTKMDFSVRTRAVVFDFGGTLTKPAVGASMNTWEKMWHVVGYDLDEPGKLHKLFMDRKITHQEWCDRTTAKLREKGFSQSHLIDVASTIRPVDGLADTLQELHTQGISLHIVSGNVRPIIAHILGESFSLFSDVKSNDVRFGQDGIISEIIGHEFDFQGKADFLRRVIVETKSDPLEVLFVGNSLNDSWASQAGVRTLCVNPSDVDYSNTRIWNDYLRPMNNLGQIVKYVKGYTELGTTDQSI